MKISVFKVILLSIIVLLQVNSLKAEETIKIGVLVPLSGNWAQLGENIQEGITLASEEVNKKRTDKKFELLFRDTDEEKSGAKVITAYRYLRSKGVKYFIGPGGVPGIMALTPLAAKDDVILIGPTATNAFYKLADKFFNAGGDNAVTTRAYAIDAYNSGARKAAIFGSLQPWENDQAKTFKEEFQKLGGEIVSEVYPEADQQDLAMEALKIKNSSPDVVFYAIFNQIAVASKTLNQLKFDSKKYASTIDDAHIVSSERALNEAKVFLFAPPCQEFKDKYSLRFNHPPRLFADTAYDAMVSLSQAIINAKTESISEVISNMLKQEFPSSSGKPMRYDQDGLVVRDIVLNKVVDDKLESQN